MRVVRRIVVGCLKWRTRLAAGKDAPVPSDHNGLVGERFPVLYDRQHPYGTVYPAFDERAEEHAALPQRQDGACQRSLPFHRVHLQAAGVFNLGIP